ncbi:MULTISPECIES: hypothetical protein [Oxalobacteraceae]|uniref:hypothetical protein n=1 Tax=Oxalobacteraceae TaxID=75682 RepID=UPI000B81ADCE|nr:MULTISPECIES: hypothetical protein [Oxalobacteraceae]
MKDAGMRIRVEPELREAFIRLCRDKDMPAARVLRAFMRDFVEREGDDQQFPLSFKEQVTEKV